MFTTTSDINVKHYQYDHEGIYIEYTVKGDQRDYHYLLPREESEVLMEKYGNDPEDDLCQMDAILIVSEHLTRKRSKLSTSDLMAQYVEKVNTDLLNSFNFHRTH
jgi:hypothetical protein